MALHRRGKWLSRQRAEIVFGLALLGGACGWLLRDQLMKRDDETPREISYRQTRLDAHRMSVRDPPAGLPLPSGALDRPASAIEGHLGASLRS